MIGRARRRSVIALALLGCGCYVPAPADPTSLAPEADLRVLLSPQGREGLNGAATVDDRGEIRGRLLTLTEDSLTIASRLPVQAGAGMLRSDLRRAVTVARNDVLQVSVPRLDRGRTGLLVGASLALIAVFVTDIFDIRGDGSDNPEPRPPDPGSPFAGRR